jgi:hypothetical protein
MVLSIIVTAFHYTNAALDLDGNILYVSRREVLSQLRSLSPYPLITTDILLSCSRASCIISLKVYTTLTHSNMTHANIFGREFHRHRQRQPTTTSISPVEAFTRFLHSKVI